MDNLFEIREIRGKGKGIVALKPLKSGTCILTESPLFLTRWSDDGSQLARVILAFNNLPLPLRTQYLGLHSWDTPTCRSLDGWESKPALDKKIISIFHCNNWEGRILYIASRFNHECVPNVESKSLVNGKFQFVLQRDVEAEEELTVTYLWDEEVLSTEERREQLGKWGFECDCPPCMAGAFVAGDHVVEVEQSELDVEV